MEVIRFFELLVVAYKNKGQHNQEERNRALMKVFPHAAPLQTTDRFMIKFLFSSTQTIQPTKSSTKQPLNLPSPLLVTT
jgi:hypothetical protein